MNPNGLGVAAVGFLVLVQVMWGDALGRLGLFGGKS